MLLNMTAHDLDLLRQFTRDQSQDAFTALVNRHVNLVFSAALRQVRSRQLAEEIAQSVFADLARGAERLKPDTVLTAWLYAVTRRTAIDVIHKESRRQLREQIAVEMNAMNAQHPIPYFAKCGNESIWQGIEPLLDEAMAALDETDRSAILLRYFENKSLREVGEALGTSDDAAQKRVSRAVEQLSDFFSKRNVTVGASVLVVLISANAVQAAPIGLAATISAAALLAGTAFSSSTFIAATKTIAMTTLQKTIVTVTVAALAGAGIYEARQAAQLRQQNQTLQQAQAPLAKQIQELQHERDAATNRMIGLLADNSRLKANPQEAELLKLRDEVGRLRREWTPAELAARSGLKRQALLLIEPNQRLARIEKIERIGRALGMLGSRLLARAERCHFWGIAVPGWVCPVLLGSKNASAAASNRPTPSAVNGTFTLLYSILSQPTIRGPAYPPMLPSAFTRPMTGPKTLRGKVSVGIAQNGASAANGPGIARHMNA